MPVTNSVACSRVPFTSCREIVDDVPGGSGERLAPLPDDWRHGGDSSGVDTSADARAVVDRARATQ